MQLRGTLGQPLGIEDQLSRILGPAQVRGRQLVSQSQALIQEAKRALEYSRDLVEGLLELREFVHENRQELGRTIKDRADKR